MVGAIVFPHLHEVLAMAGVSTALRRTAILVCIYIYIYIPLDQPFVFICVHHCANACLRMFVTLNSWVCQRI